MNGGEYKGPGQGYLGPILAMMMSAGELSIK
jgi:hypothetical protein